MGLDVNEAMAYEIASGVVQHAARISNFVRIDMGRLVYTQRTLDLSIACTASRKMRARGRGDPVLSVS